MPESDVIISGSLGEGNHGDAALLRAFLERHGPWYSRRILLRTVRAADRDQGDVIDVEPPRLLPGRRFWLAPLEQRGRRREILARGGSSRRDLVWLGGLLTHIGLHAELRARELAWAMGFCSRFIYYFGDATAGFDAVPAASGLVARLDRIESFVAVRSPEAEAVLRKAGLRSAVHVGLDAVLFELADRHGLPFRRLTPATPTLAIVPCSLRSATFRPMWLAAARAAVRLGLAVRWLSMCDIEDLRFCEELAAQLREEAPGHPQEVRTFLGDPEPHYSDVACCVATRFHGAIYGIGTGVPTIGVPYDSKVERLYQALGLGRWLPSPPPADRPEAGEGPMFELVRAALEGEFRPDYAELVKRVEAHRRILADLGRFVGREQAVPGRVAD